MAFLNNPTATTSTTGDISKDVQVPDLQTPKDSISDLQFSPTMDLLAVASWDKSVYIYEISGSGVNGKYIIPVNNEVLSVAWSTVGICEYGMHRKVAGRRLTLGRMALV